MKKIHSIGIIMDGNRRWAKAHELPTSEGHEKGYDALKKIADELPRLQKEYGLEYVTLYSFSTENWKRDPSEVQKLLALFERGLTELSDELKEKNIRIKSIGDMTRFPEKLQKLFSRIEEETKEATGGTVVFALSYGGRAEIVDAVNRLIEKGGAVDESLFSDALWTAGVPDPDLVIRTSGEQRLSNFLPWQSTYSELFFTQTLWPDFTVEELEKIFSEYQEREQRHGK